MTRKDAAGVIKFEKACVLRQDTPRCNRDCKKCDLLLPTEDVLTAYDMVIKALEQEPCENCISKEKLDKALRNFIRNFPSINPQEPKLDTLDKVRAEIDCQEKWLMSAGCNAYNVDIAFNSIRSVVKESEVEEND